MLYWDLKKWDEVKVGSLKQKDISTLFALILRIYKIYVWVHNVGYVRLECDWLYDHYFRYSFIIQISV